MPPFCHHPERAGAIHDGGRQSNIRESDGADRVLQGQPHPALQRVPDIQLLPGEEVFRSSDSDSGSEVLVDPGHHKVPTRVNGDTSHPSTLNPVPLQDLTKKTVAPPVLGFIRRDGK